MTKEQFLEKYPNYVEFIIEKYGYNSGSLNEAYVLEAGKKGIDEAFEKSFEDDEDESKLFAHVYQYVKANIIKAISEKQKKDKETFIKNFIDPTYEKISKDLKIDKKEFINYSIDINNLGIVIRNTLERYNVKYHQPELYAYENPIHISFIVDIPFVVMDIGFGIEETEVFYEAYIEDTKTKVSRKYVTKSIENLKNYIIGYLSAATQFYEIFEKNSQPPQTEDNGSGESE